MKYTVMFKDTKIRAGGHKILVSQTTADFWPNRLEVPPDLAPDFEIDGIRVGEKDQLPVPAPGVGTSAIMFAANAFGVRWNDGGMTIAPALTNIMVAVHNISKHSKTFRCCVIGNLVEDIEDEERIDGINRKLEEEMRQEAAKPLEESRLAGLEARVMMLQERVDDAKVEGKTEILAMLADLFDRQIAAALATAGISGSAGDGIKEYALGLGFTEVQGKTSATINVQPQVEFRPERLVIPASIANDFLIHDIKIGKNSQLVSTGAIPAAAFTNSSEPSRLRMDVARLGEFVTVSVTNISLNPRNFQGVFFGSSVDESWNTSPRHFSRHRV